MRALPPIPSWVALEQEAAFILQRQENHGWYFNERAAWELTQALQKELEETHEVLRKRHPFVKGEEKTPKRNKKHKAMFLEQHSHD